MELLSRTEARALKERYYYTGIACPRGHFSKRCVHNTTCYQCNCEHRASADKRNPRGVLARANKRHAAKLQRMPLWADVEKILEVYNKCPEGMEVFENRSKGNRYTPPEIS